MKLLTAKDAAEMMSISVCTVMRLADKGEFPQYKIGGSLRYDEEEILNYIKNSATPIIESSPRKAKNPKFLYVPGMKIV